MLEREAEPTHARGKAVLYDWPRARGIETCYGCPHRDPRPVA